MYKFTAVHVYTYACINYIETEIDRNISLVPWFCSTHAHTHTTTTTTTTTSTYTHFIGRRVPGQPRHVDELLCAQRRPGQRRPLSRRGGPVAPSAECQRGDVEVLVSKGAVLIVVVMVAATGRP